MREQEGKFILFDLADFAGWLTQAHSNRKILLVQNHHTFIPSYRDFDGRSHFERLVAMEQAHLQRGFSEIAQNLTTFPDGTVAVCRPLDTAPAGITVTPIQAQGLAMGVSQILNLLEEQLLKRFDRRVTVVHRSLTIPEWRYERQN